MLRNWGIAAGCIDGGLKPSVEGEMVLSRLVFFSHCVFLIFLITSKVTIVLLDKEKTEFFNSDRKRHKSIVIKQEKLSLTQVEEGGGIMERRIDLKNKKAEWEKKIISRRNVRWSPILNAPVSVNVGMS